jgi:hypothetical protein
MSYEVFRAIVWMLGLPVIVYLAWQAGGKLRAIRRRDAELREEEARNPKDPYLRLAELFDEDKKQR